MLNLFPTSSIYMSDLYILGVKTRLSALCKSCRKGKLKQAAGCLLNFLGKMEGF